MKPASWSVDRNNPGPATVTAVYADPDPSWLEALEMATLSGLAFPISGIPGSIQVRVVVIEITHMPPLEATVIGGPPITMQPGYAVVTIRGLLLP